MTARLIARGVGKAYRGYRHEWQRIARWAGLETAHAHEHWVLRDISFELHAGEAIAIVGENGAGKSTLLKLIAGTTAATEGAIERHGRIAAILELGMGFNADFSGRQNAEHSASLLGYSAAEIDAAMPEIEAFAEIGEYFDQPTRVYSSGMQMRVAFSVVTAFRPDILIVDEALAVGDAYFQHKSFERIRELVRGGTALLFVSHDPGAVRKLCSRAILLEKGRVGMDGAPDQVVDYYNALMSRKEEARVGVQQRRRDDGWLTTRSGSGEATITGARLLDAEGRDVALARVGQPVVLRVSVAAQADVPQLVLGVMLRDRGGHVIWGTNTWHLEQPVRDVRAGEALEFDIAFPMHLGPGSYSVSPALVSTDTHLVDNFDWIDNYFVFEVVNATEPYFIGSAWIDSRWSIHRTRPLPAAQQEVPR